MLNRDLKIAAIPLNIVWGDKEENMQATELAMSQLAPGTDIAVLPELFSTGFMHESDSLERMAEPMTGPTMTRILALARKYNCAIAGSMLCAVGGVYTNRAFFAEPSGELTHYDKRHLFSLSPETKIYSAGDRPSPIIRFRGWNIALIICYDLRFPVWCRNIRQQYDIMLVPANWPQARGYAWRHILIARAIENQAYVVGTNRSGTDDYGVYDDLTFIIDPMGEPVGRARGKSGIIYADISKTILDKVRTRLPFGADADTFSIQM